MCTCHDQRYENPTFSGTKLKRKIPHFASTDMATVNCVNPACDNASSGLFPCGHGYCFVCIPSSVNYGECMHCTQEFTAIEWTRREEDDDVSIDYFNARIGMKAVEKRKVPEKPLTTDQTAKIRIYTTFGWKGVYLVGVPPDGSCFFHSVVRALTKKWSMENFAKVQQLRRNLADELETVVDGKMLYDVLGVREIAGANCMGIFELARLAGLPIPERDTHLWDIRDKRSYVGDEILMALAFHLNINLLVLSVSDTGAAVRYTSARLADIYPQRSEWIVPEKESTAEGDSALAQAPDWKNDIDMDGIPNEEAAIVLLYDYHHYQPIIRNDGVGVWSINDPIIASLF